MIAIIDYGAGNTRSVMNALDRLDVSYELTDEKSKILGSDKVIFPGVGHARHAMESLKQRKLIEIIKAIKQPLLGICVGMQLLFDRSEEGDTECLGIVKGVVTKFNDNNVIVPQMGFNTNTLSDNLLFKGLAKSTYLYAVHSYRAEVCDHTIATSDYDGQYASAVQIDNFYGVQFHPEKSSKAGQLILKNFLEL
ncbi:MAG: glutamine amidotransferase [Saprospiraceae bacterium]|jgi:glutamine amidotransferase|tara:strand:+ start:359 stop:940 length:582 start_codon:yes stop_codon:yes gene_type:complete